MKTLRGYSLPQFHLNVERIARLITNKNVGHGEGGGGHIIIRIFGNLSHRRTGKQSQSGNIRFTVGQYFVRNSVNFVGIMLSNRNFSWSLIPPPPPSTTILESFPEHFFDNAVTIRKSRANFFPPPNFFLPFAHDILS